MNGKGVVPGGYEEEHPGPYVKRLTHRKKRRDGKAECEMTGRDRRLHRKLCRRMPRDEVDRLYAEAKARREQPDDGMSREAAMLRREINATVAADRSLRRTRMACILGMAALGVLALGVVLGWWG